MLDKALRYFGIIFLFALGAGAGSVAVKHLAARAIWLSCLLLAVSFGLMFVREDIEENPAIEKDLQEIRQETADIGYQLREELKEQADELKEGEEERASKS